MALLPDFSEKVTSETLSLSDGTTLEVTKPAGVDDRTWADMKASMEANPEEARRGEEFTRDAKATREWMQTSTLYEFYGAKLQGGDEAVSGRVASLEKNPDFANIFEDIKRGGSQAAMQHYYNEPLMLKVSRAMGGVPEDLSSTLEKIQKSPMTIQEACKLGATKDVAAYIKSGNDLEAKDSKGATCLAYAIGANRTEVVKLLMDAKADASACDASGGSGVHYAAAYGRKDLCEYLLKNGGDLNKKNTAGQTPLALATKNKQTATIDLLKSKGGNLE